MKKSEPTEMRHLTDCAGKRNFLSRILIRFICFSVTIAGSSMIYCQKLTRDLNMNILVNQAGYLPGSSKMLLVKGITTGTFEVVDLKDQKSVFKGQMKPLPGDFGDYSAGEFGSLAKEGRYYIKSDTLRSYPFTISRDVYRPVMNLIIKYFSLQRCGSSTTGYLSPCHTDDGIRMDNGKHQDVSGGWHDASDLRKWVSATIAGMIGLSKTFELEKAGSPRRPELIDELKWGNLYFLKMQEPQGYVMNYVGGDVKKHSDSNRWTDNKIGPDGGELKFVRPRSGKSTADMLIFGSNDDRVIRTDPADMIAQYNFIASEAIVARITKESDPAYSKKCLDAAIRCYDWCSSSGKGTGPNLLGASIQAAIEMYKTSKNEKYKLFAVNKAKALMALQASKKEGDPSGFFFASASNEEPYKDISQGCIHFISLCDLIKTFPGHPDVSGWKNAVAGYSKDYLKIFSQKNSFGIVPFGLFTSEDPGGDRKAGRYWYRYFMQPELDWWVGINANLASAGVGLCKASEVLGDQSLRAIAQRQLDWIIGSNPFNSSTIEMVGYNNPKHFPGSTFLPSTPVLPGAVLNGLGGDYYDQPSIGDGNWQISEYWTPMVAYTLWLMAELSQAE